MNQHYYTSVGTVAQRMLRKYGASGALEWAAHYAYTQHDAGTRRDYWLNVCHAIRAADARAILAQRTRDGTLS